VHRDFVERLLHAIRDSGRVIRLIQISIPGRPMKTTRPSASQNARPNG
jgi:hypothetical protein